MSLTGWRRMSTIYCTLAWPVKDGKIGFAEGKVNLNKGLLNGYGGKIEPGEDIRKAAVREIGEESNVLVNMEDLQDCGRVTFVWDLGTEELGTRKAKEVVVYLFMFEQWEGEFQETDEMGTIVWFEPEAVPYVRMHPGESHWFPILLDQGSVIGKLYYGPEREVVKFEQEEL